MTYQSLEFIENIYDHRYDIEEGQLVTVAKETKKEVHFKLNQVLDIVKFDKETFHLMFKPAFQE